MYRRGGTGFLLAYVLLSAIYALADVVKYIFELTAWIVSWLGRGVLAGTDLSRRDSFDRALTAAVEPYLSVLVAKRQKLLRADDYGVIDNKRWSKELGYFLRNVLLPNLHGYEGYARRHLALTVTLVDNIVSQRQPLPPS